MANKNNRKSLNAKLSCEIFQRKTTIKALMCLEINWRQILLTIFFLSLSDRRWLKIICETASIVRIRNNYLKEYSLCNSSVLTVGFTINATFSMKLSLPIYSSTNSNNLFLHPLKQKQQSDRIPTFLNCIKSSDDMLWAEIYSHTLKTFFKSCMVHIYDSPIYKIT